MLDVDGDDSAADGVPIQACCSGRIEDLDTVSGGCAFVVFDEAFAAVLGFESHTAPEFMPAHTSSVGGCQPAWLANMLTDR